VGEANLVDVSVTSMYRVCLSVLAHFTQAGKIYQGKNAERGKIEGILI